MNLMNLKTTGTNNEIRGVVDHRDSAKVDTRLTVLFASSAGGHLAQLLQLSSWYSDHDRTWVTFQLPDAVSLLEGEKTIWGHYPTTRNVPNLFRNALLALRVVRKQRPSVIVSSGAAIAVPFFWIGKLYGAKTVFVEVIDRIDTRTLTARLCSPVTDLVIAQDESQRQLFPGCEVIGRLL
jgi:beta-1,4-N-acetylglucosaminyltransferase